MGNIWDEFKKITDSIPEEDLAKLHPSLSQYDVGDLNDLLWDRQRLQEDVDQAVTKLADFGRYLSAMQKMLEDNKLEGIIVPSLDFELWGEKVLEVADCLKKSKNSNNYKPN